MSDHDLTLALCDVMRFVTGSRDASTWSNWLQCQHGGEWRWYREARIGHDLPGHSSQHAWAQAFISATLQAGIFDAAMMALYSEADAHLPRLRKAIDTLGAS